ncbi:SRPBCC domain-containing protein [Streptomyces sp. NPDC020800]|uniref:SRPBCC domain-containing protein n=1 Tax=Streptomyces sp. NPDC020800 TaxID=3365092 RepID=UPI0037932195
MEYQVFVPVPPDRLRAALADPSRVAGAVPGLQQDAGAEPVAGRLKLRVGGHSVTYRGTLRITPREDGTYTVEGDAVEARGTGTVAFTLTLTLADTGDGTTVVFDAAADAGGRIAELPEDAVHAALTRLLNRCAEALSESPESPESPESVDKPADGSEREAGPAHEPEPEARPETHPEAEPEPEPGHTSVFDTEVPPPSLDPAADDTAAEYATDGHTPDEDAPDEDTPDEGAKDKYTADEYAAVEHPAAADDDRLLGGFGDTGEPPAEAAHARRTMIGRSAEEVDHAPPRGRYAPVPAPQTVAGNPVLRWAAPAAALALASAIVVGRAMRRRRY